MMIHVFHAKPRKLSYDLTLIRGGHSRLVKDHQWQLHKSKLPYPHIPFTGRTSAFELLKLVAMNSYEQLHLPLTIIDRH